jgi:biopolymer transport protein ExbD
MSGLIPEEELSAGRHVNLAPMVDFLFLVVAIFAVLALTRSALFDTNVNLVKLKKEANPAEIPLRPAPYFINVSLSDAGQYKWLSETSQTVMDSAVAIQHELLKQQKQGILPSEKEQIKVLFHIDKGAKWEPIADLILAVKRAGFAIHPVYEQDDAD